MKRKLVTEDRNDTGGTFYRAINLAANGALTIEGQDLGGTVEEFFGPGSSEYEFQRRLTSTAVAKLRVHLGIDADADLLDELEARLGPLEGLTSRLEQVIEDAGIKSSFWSRNGD